MRRCIMRSRSVVASGGFGDPRSILRLDKSIPRSIPGVGCVSVTMQAATVTAEDLRRVAGLSLESPARAGIAGSTGVGIIHAVGEDVNHVSVGDAVLLLGHDGSWANIATPREHEVFRLPAALKPTEAAALPHLLSASIILSMPTPALSSSDVVLIGAGTDPSLTAALLAVGSLRGISVNTSVADVRGAHLAVSSVPGKPTTDLVRRLGPAGVLVVTTGPPAPLPVADGSGSVVALPIAKAIFTDVSVQGFDLLTWAAQHHTDILSHLNKLCAEMSRADAPLLLAPKVFPFADFVGAVELASIASLDAKVAVLKIES